MISKNTLQRKKGKKKEKILSAAVVRKRDSQNFQSRFRTNSNLTWQLLQLNKNVTCTVSMDCS